MSQSFCVALFNQLTRSPGNSYTWIRLGVDHLGAYWQLETLTKDNKSVYCCAGLLKKTKIEADLVPIITMLVFSTSVKSQSYR